MPFCQCDILPITVFCNALGSLRVWVEVSLCWVSWRHWQWQT